MPRVAKKRAHYGSGSLVEVKPGVWRIRVRSEHGQICRTVKGSEAQAVRLKLELSKEVKQGEYIPPSPIRFGEYMEEWLENVAKAKAPNTYKAYRATARLYLLPAFGHMTLQKIKASNLRTFFNELTERGLSEAYKAMQYSILLSVFKSAMSDGLIGDNPALKMAGKPQRYRIAESQSEAIKHCWTEQETRKFLAVAQGYGARQAAFYTLALDTGMRRGELCALRWSDIDLLKGTVRVSKSMAANFHVGPTKSRQARAVSISPETLGLLKRLSVAEGGGPDSPVFISTGTGKAMGPTHLSAIEFKKISRLANVKTIKFHGLRHTCATLLLAAGVPVNYVSERLGHKDPAITLRTYAHAIPSGQDFLINKLRAALGFTAEKAPEGVWKN